MVKSLILLLDKKKPYSCFTFQLLSFALAGICSYTVIMFLSEFFSNSFKNNVQILFETEMVGAFYLIYILYVIYAALLHRRRGVLAFHT